MLSLKKLRFRKKIIVLLGIFIITFGAALAFKNLDKLPKIPNKIMQIADVNYRKAKFELTPTTVVRNNNLISKSLPVLRYRQAKALLGINPDNSRYFSDGSGKAIYLSGAHTWSNLQDNGFTDPPPAFNYQKYLDFLVANNHNFFRLWRWEQAKWNTETTKEYWFSPQPYERVGKEIALDGKPKFDLTKFNQSYFNRLRQRVIEAGERGIYVSVMLFNGWSIQDKKVQDSPPVVTPENPWQGHPFHWANNVNGINGDRNNNGRGEETHSLEIPAITSLQEAYVRKVIDTVNDLDNVLYEISNESPGGSYEWQYHLISYIKNYEAKKTKQHPVGMTLEFPDSDNSKLLASPADWVSLYNEIDNPPVANGSKIILADTDHICGICGDRTWVWKSFTRGENPIFMDVYDGAFALFPPSPTPDPQNYEPWVSLRRNLGYVLTYANRMNLTAMEPHSELASTEYCLANPVASEAEYLVYLPEGGTVVVDLSAVKGALSAEWFNPDTGQIMSGIKTTGGGNRSFNAPFDGDAVLYIKGTAN